MSSDQAEISVPNGLIERLAVRVRSARAAKGLPRRALSEMSGVSPRYLAQLEAGEGNISIMLLNRVANALECRVEDLIAEADPLPGDVARVASLYAQAPASVQGRVRALLAPQNPATLKAQRIARIGLRGAGKSTLGKKAATMLRIPFVELNCEIEATAAMPIGEVVALYGFDGYRDLEAKCLRSVIDRHERMILAVSGGIVSENSTFNMLLERFHTIWIRTSPGEHMARVRAQGDLRPMEGFPAAMEQLKTLLTTREPYYERASAKVDTSNRPEQSSVNDLLTVIAKNRFLESSSV
ncbi:MAG: helix-turn-helix transcriptional regulator [Pseudomonadota bacterium]